MSSWAVEARRAIIDAEHPVLSIQLQCALLGLARSSYYYQAGGVSDADLACMRLLDEVFTRWPFYGSRRLRRELADHGHPLGRDHVRRLMRQMGLATIYPRPRLSVADQGHQVYPYLLRELVIARPNQVWCADITYIRLQHSFAYLVAVMDWHSRYVLAWELSLSLDSDFCVRALERALAGSQPEIFNTDQGCQFTAKAFTYVLKANGVTISMDGRGRVFDNIMIERVWRTLKYEDVYLHDYGDYFAALDGLDRYWRFYNHERRHSSLDEQTPAQVYWAGQQVPVVAG
jgi:putative transposase